MIRQYLVMGCDSVMHRIQAEKMEAAIGDDILWFNIEYSFKLRNVLKCF